MRTYFYLLLLFTFTGSFGFVYSQCSVSDYHLTSAQDVNGDYQFYFGSSVDLDGKRVIMKSGTLHLYWSTGQHQSYSYNSLDVSTFPVGGMGLLVTPLNLPSEGCGFVEAVFEFSISDCTTPSFTLSETVFYGTPVTGSITASAGSCGSYTFSANLTSLGITSPLWGFGDGVHSTHPSPFYTYSSNGTYIVTLQDAENPTVCPSYIEVTVSGFPSASYSWNGSCTNTSVSFHAQTAGASYSWDFGDGQTSTLQNPSHTYASADIYTVTLTVSNGTCTSTVSQQVQAGPQTPYFSSPQLCEGTPFVPQNIPLWADTYSWDFTTDGTVDATGYLINHNFTTDFTSSTVNTFNVTLTVTYGGCTSSHTQAVSVYKPIDATFTSALTGSCTYTEYTFTPSSTTSGPGITYLWTFSEPVSQGTITPSPVTHTFSGAGTYAVTLQSLNGACTRQTTQNITIGGGLGATIQSSTPYICGSGSMTLQGVLSNPLSGSSYTYVWRHVETNTVVGTSSTVTVNQAGTYELTVTDQTCSHTAQATYSAAILAVPSSGDNTVITGVSCPGASDGSIALDLSAGLLATGIDVWSSSGSYNAGTHTITGLSEGTVTYTITYTDYPLCSYTGYGSITYDGATLEVSTQASGCGSSTGSLSVSASDQSTVSNLSWTNAYNASQTGTNMTNLPTGVYHVSGLVNGCQLTSEYHQIGTYSISASHSGAYTCGASPASVTITAQTPGFSENYTFTLSSQSISGSSATFSGLSQGSHTVTITGNSSGCSTTHTFTVASSQGLTVAFGQGPINCQTLEEGEIEALVNGGSGSYSYSWNDLPSHDSPLRQDITAEVTYTVNVTDLVTGCSATGSTLIENPRHWDISSVANLGCNVTVTLSSSDPSELATQMNNGSFTVTWIQGTLSGSTFTESGFTHGSGLVTSGLPEGTYLVRVTDQNGCSEEYTYFEMGANLVTGLRFSFVFGNVPTEPVEEEPTPKQNDLLSESMTEAADALLEQLSECMNYQTGIAMSTYKDHCQSLEHYTDKMTLRYGVNYEQYTLYYYDRAGNLTKTVPPEGVEFLNTSDIASIKTHRKSGDANDAPGTWVPNHRLTTRYDYNALNQLKEQTTPDGGTGKFIYDGLQRLRFSQNARQSAAGTFSYIKYDELGRTYEAGESAIGSSGIDFTNVFAGVNQTLANNPSFPDAGTYPLRQVTQTYYSTLTAMDYYGEGQQYLQNRVSYVTRDEDGDPSTTEDIYTTYYSYDVHGNVQWLVQQDPIIGENYIKYNYDLVSGNVLDVAYNEHRKDRFFHRYSYDEDNQLILAETSRDKVLWDADGAYDYYDHGPLRSLRIGQDKIQQVDYTYTIQGWIKGINNPNQVTTQTSSSSNLTGSSIQHDYLSSAFGMSLGYYQGDFTRNNAGTANENLASGNIYGANDLFNGNISSWNWKTATGNAATSQSLTMAYRYDNLQRIKEMNSYTYDIGSQLHAATTHFATSYSFDRNGNLLTLNRNDDAGNQMDKLDYIYQDATGVAITNTPYIPRTTNILKSVTDQGTSPIQGEHSDLIHTHQYKYDEIGNLVKDTGKESLGANNDIWDVVLDIEWTVDQKVSQVNKTRSFNGTTIQEASKFHYDPMGIRVGKTYVADMSNPLHTATYTRYVHDAQGNPLGVYEITIEEGDGFDHQATLRLVERPIYGAARLGTDTREEVLHTWQFNGSNIGQFSSDGTQVLSELTNWITPLLKTTVSGDATLCQCEIRHTYFEHDVPNDTYSMKDGGEAVSYYGKTDNGVTVGETTAGELEVYSTVAGHYLGDQTVSLIFNTDNELIKGTESLNTPYRNVKPVIGRDPSLLDGRYQLYSLNEDRYPVMHRMNMHAAGWGTLASPKGEITQGNILLDDTYHYGSHMALLEDQLNGRNLVYATRYVPSEDPAACLGEVELVVFEITDQGASLPQYLGRVESSDLLGEGELQLSPDGTMLLYYNHRENIAGFAHRHMSVEVFGLDGSHTQVTTLSSIMNPNDYAGNYGKGSLDFTATGGLYVSQHGIYEQNNTVGQQDGSAKQMLYYDPLTQTLGYAAAAGDHQYWEVRRGKTQLMYVPTEGEAAVYNEWANYGAGVPVLPTQPVQTGYELLSHLPVQPHVIMASRGDVVLTRAVGYKRYELNDHLGNVRYVIGDMRVLETVTVANGNEFTVITTDQQLEWSDYYPYGSYLPTRHVEKEAYRYGFNGYERDNEIKNNPIIQPSSVITPNSYLVLIDDQIKNKSERAKENIPEQSRNVLILTGLSNA